MNPIFLFFQASEVLKRSARNERSYLARKKVGVFVKYEVYARHQHFLQEYSKSQKFKGSLKTMQSSCVIRM